MEKKILMLSPLQYGNISIVREIKSTKRKESDMKYQHYERYKNAAETVLSNLPEVFTAKEFNALRDPLMTEKHLKCRKIFEEFNQTRPNGFCRKAITEWAKKRNAAIYALYFDAPISLETLRRHNFITIDHQDFITISVEPYYTPFHRNDVTYYYKDEEVSKEIYEAMEKYEPENVRKIDEQEQVNTKRNHYRVDWNALNSYLAGDNSNQSRLILAQIENLEKQIAELRELRKEQCPNWED